MPTAKNQRTRRRPRRDWGRAIAFALCMIFALVGFVPLLLGFLLRTARVQTWAAQQTAALLHDKLGISARYDVHVKALPMMIGLNNVIIDASDGGKPFLEVEQITIRPRLFSLLAGHLDAGDVQIIGPHARVVLHGGKLQNLALSPPKTEGGSEGPDRTPISSIAVTDAHLDLIMGDMAIRARGVDLDVSVEEGEAFEIALRTGMTTIARQHAVIGFEDHEDSVDEDVICRFDTRIRLEQDSVLVRRLTLQGSADFDPDLGTTPSCTLYEGDWRSVEVDLGAFRILGLKQLSSGGLPSKMSGRVRARLPLPLAHRFMSLPHATGSVLLDVEADYEAGATLPRVEGTVKTLKAGIDGKIFSDELQADLRTTSDAIQLTNVTFHWADGNFAVEKAEIKPFAEGVTLAAGPITFENVEMTGLLRDLGAHPRAHVAWTLKRGRFEHFGGTLNPLSLEGTITTQTEGFEIFDRPAIDPTRRHMMGVKEGNVRGNFMVKPHAVVLSNFAIDTPKSHLMTTVSIGFKSILDIDVYEGSKVDLAEISPLTSIEIGGLAALKVGVHGDFGHPKITGDLGVKDFMFGGFPIGDVQTQVLFEPLVLTLKDARVKHGRSAAKVPTMRIAFDDGPDVLVDADIDTRDSPHLSMKDFLEIFRFDKDPRFVGYEGIASGAARIHYALGGPQDRCGGGYLNVRTNMQLDKITLLGETYDDGEIDLDFLWDDQAAGANGMRIDLRSATLRKGTGSAFATASIRHGGVVTGNLIANGIPLGRIDALGKLGPMLDGSVSLTASLGGTLAQLESNADINISRIRIGPSTLPTSRFQLTMLPSRSPSKVIGKTVCRNDIGPPFDPAEFQKDLPDGEFQVSGALLGGQILVDDVRITKQERKVVKGKLQIQALDLGTLANLIPGVAFAASPPKGTLTASVDIERLPLSDPKRASVSAVLNSFEVERSGRKLHLTRPSGTIRLDNNELDVPELNIEGRTASGISAHFVAGGKVHKAITTPDLAMAIRVEPTTLSRLGADLPQVKRANGTVQAELYVNGPPSALRYSGAAELKDGELDIVGLPVSLDEINVAITISSGDVRLKRASAKLGNGTISATGRMPVHGLDFGTAQASITVRGVKLPVSDGINLTADADLDASFKPDFGLDEEEGERNLPMVRGTISLNSFSYTRPIAMSVDLGQLAGRQRTVVDTYDPADDVVRFDVNIVSPKPLRFSNNLVDMKLLVASPGLSVSGTNQRFGARGTLRILPDSKLTLRTTEFNVRDGQVRFEDPYRIAPKVDVRAETEYRRYAASAVADSSSAGSESAGSSSTAASSASTSGQWRIKMHAHGDAEDLRLVMTSDPPLSQEDIILLLTFGLTRAEMDRGLASSLGETVGLEALSTLTGADKAVKTIVPIIDEFRFGTGYSSRTGRTEPTVTLGKRLTDNVRANVTTGLTENREVRSGVEVKLNQRMSVQGSYDNVNDATSSSLGNLGADLRWRLEFE